MNKPLLLLVTASLLFPAIASAQTSPAPSVPVTPVPTTAPTTTSAPAAPIRAKTNHTANTVKALPTSTVHINSASVADLLTLPEVTPKIADSIVKNRPYRDVNELVKKVKGIGPKNVKKIQPYIDFK